MSAVAAELLLYSSVFRKKYWLNCSNTTMVSADAAAASLSANSETAAVPVLAAANAGNGASQWCIFTHA